MTDSFSSTGPLGPKLPIGSTGRSESAGRPAADKTAENGQDSTTPAFQVLLERLQAQASALRDTKLDGPEELSGAVDTAGETLRDALELRDQLLEAYRERQHLGDSSKEA
ncbi:MAG: hypothetical protein AAF368_14045 [Planctomycetota bacterium]